MHDKRREPDVLRWPKAAEQATVEMEAAVQTRRLFHGGSQVSSLTLTEVHDRILDLGFDRRQAVLGK